MICLDTNYLIKGLEPGSTEAARIAAAIAAGAKLATGNREDFKVFLPYGLELA